jgi:hypothetical protein
LSTLAEAAENKGLRFIRLMATGRSEEIALALP